MKKDGIKMTTDIFEDNFTTEDNMHLSDSFSKLSRLYTGILFTSFACFVLLGVYFFHSYIFKNDGYVILSTDNIFRSLGLISLFEVLPFLLIIISGFSRYGFFISFLILAIKGILIGFSLYSLSFDEGLISFTPALGVFAVYSVLYCLAYVSTGVYASASSNLCKHEYKTQSRLVAKKYLLLIFPYIVLFFVTAILDYLHLGF